MKRNFYSRIINKFYTWLVRHFKQHVICQDGIKLKYLLFESKRTDNLIVVFPAFADKGAKYNYVHTLKFMDATKVFFLDDFAENKRGNYLLGNKLEILVKDVISSVINKTSPNNIFFVGSSKGGYCALYYSFFFKDVTVCIAAPQYYLGDYLIERKEMKPNLKAIVGNVYNESAISNLNLRLQNLMKSSSMKPRKVYLHYSDKEHTYKEHIIWLIRDLQSVSIDIDKNVEHYNNHSDLVQYYPAYLKKTIKEILNSKLYEK